MYRVIEVIIKTDEDPEELKAKAKKIGDVTSWHVGPKVYERTIDGETYTRTEEDD